MKHHYISNDRAFRNKRLDSCFFVGVFYATKKKGSKSARGSACCQLFVTDEGHAHIVPIRKKSEVLLAMKLFEKDLGVPDAIITYAAVAETS